MMSIAAYSQQYKDCLTNIGYVQNAAARLAAHVVVDGRVVAGCNVENASYGLGLCAECSLVSALTMQQAGKLVAFTCCDKNGDVLMPCGRCRQLLFEHSAPELVLDTVSGFKTIAEVLPDAFGPNDLNI